MTEIRSGMTAVIFTSTRNGVDGAGYGVAADAMERLAALQPGYIDFESARGTDGFGITVSYWTDEASAIAWRDHPEHEAIRDAGRAIWYDAYRVVVATVDRAYDWARAA